MVSRKYGLAATVTGGIIMLGMSAAQGAQVDIVNDNGTIDDQFMSSNGGLSSDGFAGSTANGVSVWLRARNQGDQGPVSRVGNIFRIREATGANQDRFAFEFQFSPRDGDTRETSNYFLSLQLDSDPGTGVSFGDNTNTFFGRVFDDNGEDELLDSGRESGTAADRSWDDGDSVAIDGVTERGTSSSNTQPVDFVDTIGDRDSDNLPAYVVANSWLAEWDFSSFSLLGDDFGGAPGPGFYDIALTAFEDSDGEQGDELASVQITTQVGQPVPEPSLGWLLATGGVLLIGTTVQRRRRPGSLAA